MPHYRYSALVGVDSARGLDAAQRSDFAFGDVASAFEAFLRCAGTRPFFLAGHSQGSIIIVRLLKERVAKDDGLKGRLVGAYAPGVARLGAR